jgi:outer membrane protein assembly factor BamB
MNSYMNPRFLPWLVGILGVALAGWFWFAGTDRVLVERLPGADRGEGETGAGAVAKWDGRLVKGQGVIPTFPGVWPGFRGAGLTGISEDPVPLARNWGPQGPKALWQVGVGEGFAAAAIWKGQVFVLDYDQTNRMDAIRCLSLSDGQEIWRYTYSARLKRNHGMSRTIPAVTEKFVVTLGPKCNLVCLNRNTGDLVWQMDLVREFNTEVPPWYAGQCPLIDGDKVIVAPGNDALMAAIDLASGTVLWKSANPRNWLMTHSSITPIEFGGKRMYVYCASGGVAGVSAVDGTILWDMTDWKISIANVPSPVYIGEGRLFFCGGYNAGSMMVQLKTAGDRFELQTLFRLKATEFGSTQQTPILFQEHLFGVRPDGQLVCLNLNGKTVWQSGAANKFGAGPYLIAQGLIYVMNDHGVLTMAEASTSGYKQLGQATVLPGPDSWGPLALADGFLVARDNTQVICLQVGAR